MFFFYQNYKLYYYSFNLIYNCSPRISRHGNFFSKDELRILQTTKLNKSEIIEILGQPSTKSTFLIILGTIFFLFKKKKHILSKKF